MFFDVYASLCKSKGKKPSVVAAELGINKSNVSNWKNNGYTPRGEVLQRIADYFEVTTDYLLGNGKAPADTGKRFEDGTPSENINVLRMAGRDGSYREKRLTDEQFAAFSLLVDQLPDASDDL